MSICTDPSCLTTTSSSSSSSSSSRSSSSGDHKSLEIFGFVAFGLCMVLLGLNAFGCKRWSCFSLFSQRHVAPQPEYRRNDGPVENKAGLMGMKREERRRILEHILAGTPFSMEMANSVTSQSETNTNTNNNTNTTKVGDYSDVSTFSRTDVQSIDSDLTLFTRSTNRAKDDCEIGGQGVVVPNANAGKHDETCCSICLNDYEPNDLVVSGASCNHFFHTDCVLDWLDKHDHCPFCRQEMITADQMKEAATKILGTERVSKLMAHTIRQSSADYGAAWDFDV